MNVRGGGGVPGSSLYDADADQEYYEEEVEEEEDEEKGEEEDEDEDDDDDEEEEDEEDEEGEEEEEEPTREGNANGWLEHQHTKRSRRCVTDDEPRGEHDPGSGEGGRGECGGKGAGQCGRSNTRKATSRASWSRLQQCVLFARFDESTAAPSRASGAQKVFAEELSKHEPEVTEVGTCFLSMFNSPSIKLEGNTRLLRVLVSCRFPLRNSA
jgi:hypothetical protein